MNIWGHITHYPVDAHPDLVAQFEDVVVDREDFSEAMQAKFEEALSIGGDLNAGMRHYLGDVYSLDQSVARVLRTIDELGIRENTIVIFSSDHGPAPVLLKGGTESKEFSANMLGYAGEFRGGKHTQYEGGARSPFIVRWPGHVRAGHTDTSSVISGMDWLPTLCSIVGIKDLPDGLDGEDVSDMWIGAERDRTTPLIWRTSSPNASPSMRVGKWKLHLNRKAPVELYDLEANPSESRNLAEAHPEVVAKLGKKLEAWVAELPTSYDKSDPRKGQKKKRKKK